jgi:CheY-like chemotaxis protein
MPTLALQFEAFPVLIDALVLVVDPHPATRAGTAAMLAVAGVRCLQAVDGEQALKLMRIAAAMGHPLDGVLLDVRSWPVDGWITAQRLRAEPGGRRAWLPLFALCTGDTSYDQPLAERFGATALVPVPCPAGALRDALGEAIDLARRDRMADAPVWPARAANDPPCRTPASRTSA